MGSSVSSPSSAGERQVGFCHGVKEVLREQRHCRTGGGGGNRASLGDWMDPKSLPFLYLTPKVIFFQILTTQGAKGPIHLISHPRFLQLGPCGQQGCVLAHMLGCALSSAQEGHSCCKGNVFSMHGLLRAF